jgi:lipopolysaccharide transport system ATP-binding protein
MSSDDIAIRVKGLGKRYEIYSSPRDRLKQFVVPALRRMVGAEPRNYFDEFWALRDISFEIKKGEAFGVVGRNGSGKSTLLQLVTGTLAPTTGTIETHGRIAALLELGSGFNPDFTGRENVFLNGMVLGLTRKEIEQRFDDIAAFADIGAHLDQPTRTYSSGMLVRLAFAVQVQVKPDILIIDEALAVGDALFQKRCYEHIEKMLASGVTLMFVSHDQETVRTLTSSAMLLRGGVATAAGSSSDVILAYRKQLHDDETAYFGELAQRARRKGRESSGDQADEGESSSSAADGADSRSGALTFGDGGVHVVGVRTFAADGQASNVFRPGEPIRIVVTCCADEAAEKLNVSIRIRSKQGVKIYSWGTLNQDMQRIRASSEEPRFWDRIFAAGEQFDVELTCDCTLGGNLYEIQACVSYEDEPDYTAQRILHWLDEAAFFQVAVDPGSYFFGGAFDLRMRAEWQVDT